MDYDEPTEDSRIREKMKPVYLWVPASMSFVVIGFTLLLKLVESKPDGFMAWGWVVLVWIVVLIGSFGVSFIWYSLVSLKDQAPKERQLNSRGRCDELLRREIMHRTACNLEDFTETGDSVEGVGWYGAGQGKNDQDSIYYHLYRIKKNGVKRYLLGVMNREAGKEDDVRITQSPMNFQDLKELIKEEANQLCRNPVRTVMTERIYTDELSGRSRVERSQGPLDQPENQDGPPEAQP